MCVDSTDLNVVWPKDPYPLPNIERLIDGSPGYKSSTPISTIIILRWTLWTRARQYLCTTMATTTIMPCLSDRRMHEPPIKGLWISYFQEKYGVTWKFKSIYDCEDIECGKSQHKPKRNPGVS